MERSAHEPEGSRPDEPGERIEVCYRVEDVTIAADPEDTTRVYVLAMSLNQEGEPEVHADHMTWDKLDELVALSLGHNIGEGEGCTLTVRLDEDTAYILKELVTRHGGFDENYNITDAALLSKLVCEGLALRLERMKEHIEMDQGLSDEKANPELQAARRQAEGEVWDWMSAHIERVGVENIRPGGIAHQFMKFREAVGEYVKAKYPTAEAMAQLRAQYLGENEP